jgi:hypothetical protein
MTGGLSKTRLDRLRDVLASHVERRLSLRSSHAVTTSTSKRSAPHRTTDKREGE